MSWPNKTVPVPSQGDTKLATQPSIAAPYSFQRRGTAGAMVPSRKWKVERVGDRWAALRPWAGSVWWLRYFDTFSEAQAFVQYAIAKAAVTR